MKQSLLLGLLLAGWWAPAAWPQGGLATPPASPTLRKQSFQVLDGVNGSAPVTLDLHHEGETYLLDLEPHDLRARDFRVLLDEGGTYREIEPPPVTTYRGTVHDARGNPIEGAQVAASRTPAGWEMMVTIPGLADTLLVQPASELDPGLDAPGLHAVYTAQDVLPTRALCEVGAAEPASSAREPAPEEDDAGGDPPALAATGEPVVWIAFDADVEYYQLLGSDPAAVVADIESLMNDTEVVFERDARVTFEITTIVVRTTPVGADPYAATSAGGLLAEMETHWNDKQGGIRRALANLMTGKSLSGEPGAANGPVFFFKGVVCRPHDAYSVIQPRFTTNLALRVALLAHYLAHNFGAPHCDAGLLETTKKCFIMCSTLGGCDGIGKPTFGSPARGIINRNGTNAGCNHPEPAALSLPFVDEFPSDPPDPAKWLFNDFAQVTARANTAEPSEPAALKLNANKNAPGYQDDIRTVLIDASQASALTLSFMSQRKGVEAGEQLVIDYVASGVPGWTELARLTSDGVNQAGFEAQSFDLPANALHPELRIRFRIEANQADDRWFVDDVVLEEPAGISSGPFELGQPLELAATGAFPGSPVAFYYSFAGPDAVPTGGDSGRRLELLPPVGLLDVVRADERGRAVTSLFAPASAPPTELWVQAVRVRPLTPRDATSSVLHLSLDPDRGGVGAERTTASR